MRIQSQIFLRDDLDNILRALAQSAPQYGEYGDGFRAALVAVGTAIGMGSTEKSERKSQMSVLNGNVDDLPYGISAYARIER